MVAFTYSMPAGIAGAISRAEFSAVEAGLYDSNYAFASYGLPAKLVSGKARPLAASDDPSLVAAFLVRPYPGHAASQSDPLGGGTPSTSGICNLMKRGYMTVKNNAGTPAAEGQVYVRVANASAGKPIGGIEAAAEANGSQAGTSAAKTGGNTGNGTMGAITVAAGTSAGVYQLRVTKAVTNAGDFELISPAGVVVGIGAVAAAFSQGGLSFTLADGATDFVVGDGFDITVTAPYNTVAIPNCVFKGAADSSGNVEIAYKM